jgi:predicted enzyme related to lactoylglutathione lyase
MGDAVVYFEIGAADDGPLLRFYQEMFGWKATATPGINHATVDTLAGTGINGGIGRSGTGEPWSTFYVEVGDLQATLDKAGALGGEIVLPVIEVPGLITFAMFNDPDGLLIGLLQAGTRPPGAPGGPTAGEGSAVDWFEVLGSDAAATQAFYRELFGWNVDASDTPSYAMVDTQAGRGIPGGIGGGDNPDTRWATVYAQVPSIEQALERAERLGGTRVYGPLDLGGTRTGLFRDPVGNPFGVYQLLS